MAETQGFNPAQSLKNMARNAPWVTTAVALHLIVIAAAGIFYTASHGTKDKEQNISVELSKPRPIDENIEIPPEQLDRKAIPKNEEAEIVSMEEDVYIPTTEVPEDLFQDRGDPNSVDNATGGSTGGTAIGVGNTGHAGTRPSAFAGRRLGSGVKKGRPGGPTQGIDRAILDGLRWLVRHQNPDGSWGLHTLKDRCQAETPCQAPNAPVLLDPHFSPGLTGMAILCFLGAGFSHESKQDLVDTEMGKRYKIGEVVKNGLMWLAKKQDKDGYFSSDRVHMYNEALAGMAMAEAFGLTQNRYWKEPAQRSIDFIQKSQRPNPSGTGLWGWRYDTRMYVEERLPQMGASTDRTQYKELYDADTSATAWCIMALKSAQISGLKVSDESMKGGLEFAKFVTGDEGKVGYLDAKGAGASLDGPGAENFTYNTESMSALGMCIRIFCEHDDTDPFLELAAKRLVKNLPAVSKDGRSLDYYYWYYGSLALNQIDGPDAPKRTNKYWGPWNKAMVDAVIGTQDHTDRTCSHGGWMQLDRWAREGGVVYTTAVNVLTLEVYYRYENAFGGAKRN